MKPLLAVCPAVHYGLFSNAASFNLTRVNLDVYVSVIIVALRLGKKGLSKPLADASTYIYLPKYHSRAGVVTTSWL